MCRKLIYLNSFVLVLGLVLTSAANAADPGLVGWWKLDDNATDSSGNGHDGVLYGDPQWVAGKIGGALEFDGVDDRVEMPGTSAAEGFPALEGEVTWTVWFKTPGGALNPIMIQDPPGAAHVSGNRSLNVESSGMVRVRGNSVAALNSYNSNAAVNDDQWHHVAVTIAFETNGVNDTMKLYIDGDLSKGYEIDVVDINSRSASAADFIIVLGYNGTNAFTGQIDDVRVYSRVLTEDEIKQVMIGAPPGRASGPDPADQTTDVPRDVMLSWAPGDFAATHDVYLGTVFDDVNEASRSDQRGVLAGQGQLATTYDPPGRLDLGQTYYWRIDEVNAPPTSTIFKGDVWSFTVEPLAYPIEATSITTTASSSNSAAEGPENTINGSGLNADDLHSAANTDMWLSSMTGAQPTWIQYEFDRVYKLHQMLVWNHNTLVEAAIGFGTREATIEYSADGTDWTTLGTTHEFTRGHGVAGYASNTTVDFGGAAAKYVRVTANSNWGGIVSQFGLSEVRFLSIPVLAQKPNPASGATDIGVDATLSWKPGREAAKHDVYLSTDEQAVIDGTAAAVTVPAPSYVSSFDLGGTYYWRVDEVNDVETPTTWQGDVWSLSTQEYLVVEDFESYNDIEAGQEGSDLVYETWIDGFGTTTNGSTIGYTEAFQPSMEISTVYDGKQSVPLFYNNTTASISEVTANVANLQAAQDWSMYGIKGLTLRFYGDPNNNVQQMYAKVNGAKVIYDGSADNLKRAAWQMWYIDLTSLGVNLGNVTTLTIGLERIGGAGGQGMILLDGLRLYSYERQWVTPVAPDTTNLIAHWKLDETSGAIASDSSGNNHHGDVFGNPAWVIGILGGALQFDGVDDRVEMPTTSAAQGFPALDGEVTWSLWLKTAPGTVGRSVMVQGPAGAAHVQGNRSIAVEPSGAIMLRAHSVAALANFNSNMRVDDNEWHHVAVAIAFETNGANDTLKVCIDGDLGLGFETDSADINQYGGAAGDFIVTLGARGTFYNGLLDDVAVFNRALSQEEMAGLAGRTDSFYRPF